MDYFSTRELGGVRWYGVRRYSLPSPWKWERAGRVGAIGDGARVARHARQRSNGTAGGVPTKFAGFGSPITSRMLLAIRTRRQCVNGDKPCAHGDAAIRARRNAMREQGRHTQCVHGSGFSRQGSGAIVR